MPMWHWDGHMGWGWGWMGIFWLIAIVILAAIVWFAVAAGRRNGAGPAEETPEQALKRRYAKGELDRETYLRTLEDLRK